MDHHNQCNPQFLRQRRHFLPSRGWENTKTHNQMIQHGIITITDLKSLETDQLPKIRSIKRLHQTATNKTLPGSSPVRTIDHRESENPYKSLYGEDWKVQIAGCTALSQYRPVSDLVDFMAAESKRLMQGTVHERDRFLITMLSRC